MVMDYIHSWYSWKEILDKETSSMWITTEVIWLAADKWLLALVMMLTGTNSQVRTFCFQDDEWWACYERDTMRQNMG